MISKILYVSLVTLLFFSGCGKKDETKPTEEKTQKQAETNASNIINLQTTKGENIKLTALENGILFENYQNKVVLLDFFATWCPPCIAEIPHLNEIQTSYKDRVQIIGVLMEESKNNEEIEAFINSHAMNFPITNSKANFTLSDALGGIRSLPTMVMYDKNGEYFTHYIGAAPQEMIEADIRKALAK
ncbi:MAG: TlpA family protein disulfide reductase [Epsilonproteobacteria bacterium]|nr:TlpA family protein disulfide reductase [Campylobacterota bacterium]